MLCLWGLLSLIRLIHKAPQDSTNVHSTKSQERRPHGAVRVDMQVAGALAAERGPCRVEASTLLTSSLSGLVVFLIKFTFLFV